MTTDTAPDCPQCWDPAPGWEPGAIVKVGIWLGAVRSSVDYAHHPVMENDPHRVLIEVRGLPANPKGNGDLSGIFTPSELTRATPTDLLTVHPTQLRHLRDWHEAGPALQRLAEQLPAVDAAQLIPLITPRPPAPPHLAPTVRADVSAAQAELDRVIALHATLTEETS